jgi:hypothetical protein
VLLTFVFNAVGAVKREDLTVAADYT